MADLFPDNDDPVDKLKKELIERQKKFAAGRVGSPGKVSTLLGYSGEAGQQQ